MNRRSALAAISGSLLLGVLLGIALARRGSDPAGRPDGSRDNPARPFKKLSADPSAVSGLQDEVLTLRRRIRDLERKTAAPSPVPSDRPALANDLYREMSDPHLFEDVKRWTRATGLMADLDPSMASVFIERYRAKQPHGDPMALELALGCGGPEVMALLKEIFGNPGTPKTQRQLAGVCMTGESLLSLMRPEYPPEPALVDLASRYIGSAEPADRRCAIGLLRLQPGDNSRAQLTHVLSYDQDESIRMAAIVSLGTVGDRSTLTLLRDYAARSLPKVLEADHETELKPIEYTLQYSLELLKKKFPD
jgi:hypothetical protein